MQRGTNSTMYHSYNYNALGVGDVNTLEYARVFAATINIKNEDDMMYLTDWLYCK